MRIEVDKNERTTRGGQQKEGKREEDNKCQDLEKEEDNKNKLRRTTRASRGGRQVWRKTTSPEEDNVSVKTWKKRRTKSIAAWVERAVLRSLGSDQREIRLRKDNDFIFQNLIHGFETIQNLQLRKDN